MGSCHLELQIKNTRKNPRQTPGRSGSSNEDSTATRSQPKPPEGENKRQHKRMQPRGTNARLTRRGLTENGVARSEGGCKANAEGTEEEREHRTQAENTRGNTRRTPGGGRGRSTHVMHTAITLVGNGVMHVITVVGSRVEHRYREDT